MHFILIASPLSSIIIIFCPFWCVGSVASRGVVCLDLIQNWLVEVCYTLDPFKNICIYVCCFLFMMQTHKFWLDAMFMMGEDILGMRYGLAPTPISRMSNYCSSLLDWKSKIFMPLKSSTSMAKDQWVRGLIFNSKSTCWWDISLTIF